MTYVSTANLLAYMTSDTAFNDPVPINDQTIWDIGTTANGVFTGTSTATFQIGPGSIQSTTTMNGLITDSGQVRIAFSSDSAPTAVGIGQVRDVAGETYIQHAQWFNFHKSHRDHHRGRLKRTDGVTILQHG